MLKKSYIVFLSVICMTAITLSACTKSNDRKTETSDDTIEVTIPQTDGGSDADETGAPDDSQVEEADMPSKEESQESLYNPAAEDGSSYADFSMTAHNYQPDEEFVNPYPERVINITNIRELGLLLGASFQSAYTLIDQYAADHNIAAKNVTMVGYYLDGEFGQRTPIYLRFDDPDETMAMLIYDMTYPEPANAIQIQDSDLTMGDVRLQWWYKGED